MKQSPSLTITDLGVYLVHLAGASPDPARHAWPPAEQLADNFAGTTTEDYFRRAAQSVNPPVSRNFLPRCSISALAIQLQPWDKAGASLGLHKAHNQHPDTYHPSLS